MSDSSIDFQKVFRYAQYAHAAYDTPDSLKQQFSNLVTVQTTSRDVQFFVITDQQKKEQIVSVRGTSNFENFWQDGEYVHTYNQQLGVYLHHGFNVDAQQVYQQLMPSMNKQFTTVLTGHSLGAAIAVVLMMYFQKEGYPLAPTYNFGQPKLTNKAGSIQFESLPVIRVVDEEDLVPLLPPTDLIDLIHGGYVHLGAEVLLLNKQYYAFEIQSIARQQSVASLWKNRGHESLKAHYMANYLANLEGKIQGAEVVSYEDRWQYEE